MEPSLVPKRIITTVWPVLSMLILPGCSSIYQDPSTALIRAPGDRTYGDPVPASVPAKEQWEYAVMSELAYPPHDREKEQIRNEKRRRLSSYKQSAQCQDFSKVMKASGWEPWLGFPSGFLLQHTNKVNLGVQVWQNNSKDVTSIIVAFRGTEFWSLLDWKSNLRWILRFIPRFKDEYSEIVNEFGPEFIKEYKHRMEESGNKPPKRVKLYSTGHSLGGGLAQQFAYALPIDENVPRVTQVYAFDPSPVTGYFSVEAGIRDINVKELKTDRAFEHGEILSYVRSLTSLVFPPSKEEPAIRGIRYNLFPSWNPLSDHSMQELACKLWEVSGQGGTQGH